MKRTAWRAKILKQLLNGTKTDAAAKNYPSTRMQKLFFPPLNSLFAE